MSGLHVTVLYGVGRGAALVPATGSGRSSSRPPLVLLFYQFLAGFMPSLLRATVMIVIGGIAVLLDRDGEPINVLALSGIVLLLIDPFQAFTLSFQLSFLALGRDPRASAPSCSGRWHRSLPRFLLLAFAMSAGAQAATLPLVIGRFGS